MQSGTEGLCRDCMEWQTSGGPAARCKNCGSPRVLWHAEIRKLAIAHIDCDAFYASVEKRDNPELANKPVIIGGGKRGVVSTACYIARIRGVHSAMPMFKALAACPDAVVLPPKMEKYVKVGKQIRSMMLALTPQVEPLSIDEAFLDLTGTEKLHGACPAEVLVRFVRQIEQELDLTVSVGMSYCKFLAKIASDMNKPRGFSIIGKDEALDFLRRQPVSIVWGVGKVTQAMLARDGIRDLASVQDMAESDLAKRYGAMGLHLSRLARGKDSRAVTPGSGAKSISAETTFNEDVSDPEKLLPILRSLSQKVSSRLKKSHIAGQTIMLKLKTSDFKTRTRTRQIPDPTQLADRIFRTARELALREIDGTKFRLLGVGVSTLGPDENADPQDLVDIDATRRAQAERAMDTVLDRFGNKAIEYGITFKK